jgi:hypothetical protein
MYDNDDVKNHIEQSSSVSTNSLVIAEWNLNIADNIDKVGNYRYRPTIASPTINNYGEVAPTYDSTDTLDAYTEATDSYTTLVSGIDTATNEPTLFSTKNKKEETLYSLSECLNRFRPRSGINKLRYFEGKYLNTPNRDMFSQPRYYLSSKQDKFKYWDSYREEPVGSEIVRRGVGNQSADPVAGYFMDDTAPFVVYKNPVPANRVVIKMQTHSSKFNNSAYQTSNNKILEDPFWEDEASVVLQNQVSPYEWKVQYLNTSNTWTDIQDWTPSNQTRANGKRIVPSDGYVELFYGMTNTLPTNFKPLGEHLSLEALPIKASIGDAYLVPDIDDTDAGIYYVWNGTNWTTNSFVPTYGWYLGEEEVTTTTQKVTQLTSPKMYGTASNKHTANYREFQFIKGLRIVVKTISQKDSRFELIEMSPRLVADFSDRTVSYSIDKIASDIGNSGFPVGELSVSSGQIDIFDYDQAFNVNNELTLNGSGKVIGSILSSAEWDISSKNLQFKFYESIKDVLVDGLYKDYYIPIKVMYIDGFPKINSEDRKVQLTLRDLFFYFESITAPQLLLRDVTLTYAVATILDSIGFSNYIFKYGSEENDFVIPYFYVQPDINVAEVLKSLAESSQTAMFFDEVNNFVLMSKDYLMGTDKIEEDITLYGTKDFAKNGIMQNESTSAVLSNIVSFESEDNVVYNAGKIVYNNKYLQKSYSKIREASVLPKNQVFRYKPVLLWEVAGTPSTRALNEEIGNQNSYTLAAMALNDTLTNQLPFVDSSGNIQNNVMDFGQTIYWATRYNGYLYANGEIIKYDAIEHARTTVSVKDVAAQINSANKKVLRITSTNFDKLRVGQKLSYNSGSATLAANTVIEKVDKSTNRITINNDAIFATSNADIEFDVVSENTNVWVTSVEEYQKYFSEIPFNGKLYPTGRVRIYTEPYYNADGTIDKSKPYKDVINGSVVSFTGATTKVSDTWAAETDRGAVAKHGRIQFETGVLNATLKTNMPIRHDILDKANPWVASPRKVFKMNPDSLFKQSTRNIVTEYTTTTAANTIVYSAAGTLGTVTGSGPFTAEISALGSRGNNFVVGEKITATAGTGSLGSGTVTVTKVVNGTKIKISSTAAMTPGTLTNIGGTPGTTGSKVLRTSTAVTTLKKGFVLSNVVTGIPTGTKIQGTKTFKVGSTTYNLIVLDKAITATVTTGNTVKFATRTEEALVKAAISFNTDTDNAPDVDTLSIDKFDTSYYLESTDKKNEFVKRAKGSIRSSALTLRGAYGLGSEYMSYVYKQYEEGVTPFYFGTRIKIVGEVQEKKKSNKVVSQIPMGSFSLSQETVEGKSYDIQGTGGGIAINLDTTTNTNVGYYFEIDALTINNILSTTGGATTAIPNVYFYKMLKGASSGVAVPKLLWYGSTEINVDDGLFSGLETLSTADSTSYDLAIEQVQDVSKSATSKTFNLYINNKLIATVVDNDALPTSSNYNKMALFVRGSGNVMFENVFEISNNISADKTISDRNSTFNEQKFDNKNFRPYLMNPSVLDSYLKEIGINGPSEYRMKYDEFGTIMRECAYFNVRYDKAYPALYSRISPTLNSNQGYVISGYNATAYNAEFLVFNATDFALALDDTTGNYLRIQGVSFTQQSEHDLTVDEYFAKHSDSSNYSDLNKQYRDIQNSRSLYNRNDFTIQGEYIQSLDVATNLMRWIVDKIMKPKKSIGVKIFANPMIQLGDIVTIDYEQDGVPIVPLTTRFVVYHTKFSRTKDGPEMTLYLSEVV